MSEGAETDLHHEALLLLRALPPQSGQLVDLRVQELVLGLVGLDVVLHRDERERKEENNKINNYIALKSSTISKYFILFAYLVL